MKKIIEGIYDAVGIEHSLASLLERTIGGRGGPHDADHFRRGSVKDLGNLLEAIADALEKRCARIEFKPNESEAGGNEARIRSAIAGLRKLGTQMKLSPERETEDYHWLIIGELALVLDGVLKHHDA